MFQELFDEACYFFDDWLRLMGYGGEYQKLVEFLRKLKLLGFKFNEKYYYIWLAIGKDEY